MKKRRPFHKRILLHPLTVLLILFVGILMFSVQNGSSALDVSVFAKVAAPLPTSPAVIQIIEPEGSTEQIPAQGANTPQKAVVVYTKIVTLSGQCPKNSYLDFYRNGVFAGSTACIGDTFSIKISLLSGLNKITVRVFNITGDQGPVSRPVYIYEKEKTSPAISPTSGTSALQISAKFNNLGFLVGQTGDWQITVSGGIPPYGIDINWGDGLSSHLARQAAGIFNINHVYKLPSGATGYEITVIAQDARGQKAELSIVTVISQPNSARAKQVEQANLLLNPNLWTRLRNWLVWVWPLYIILLLMIISFWLGEREEDEKLANKYGRSK